MVAILDMELAVMRPRPLTVPKSWKHAPQSALAMQHDVRRAMHRRFMRADSVGNNIALQGNRQREREGSDILLSLKP